MGPVSDGGEHFVEDESIHPLCSISESMLQFVVIAVCRCAFNKAPHFCNPPNIFIRQRLLIDARQRLTALVEPP